MTLVVPQLLGIRHHVPSCSLVALGYSGSVSGVGDLFGTVQGTSIQSFLLVSF